jgi:hypothetical protein
MNMPGRSPAGQAATLDYDYPWLEQFLRRASGFHFTEEQVARIVEQVERKLHDLFEVAEEAAVANGREIVMRHDLPLTKGLRATMREHDAISREIRIAPALRFLGESGLTPRYDEMVKAEVPALLGALVVLAGRIIAIIDPDNLSPAEQVELLRRENKLEPTRWEVKRAAEILDLTL